MIEACTVVFPEAQQRDDLFHALALLGDLGQHLDNIAYRSILHFDKAAAKQKRAKARAARRELERVCEVREDEMDMAIERADTFEALRRSVEELLSLCSPGSRTLRQGDAVRAWLPTLAEEIAELGGDRAEKVSKYLANRVEGLSSYLDALAVELASCTADLGDPALVGSVVRAYEAGLRASRGQSWQRWAGQIELEAAVVELVEISETPARLTDALERVIPLLERRHRASSAIECVHSVIRPYIAVHKHLSQGFLDLLRFYWNTRTRRWGRHKGTSALQSLTGEAHHDWLTLLGFPKA